MLCMCVNFHRPEKKHKETFLISYFSVTKRRVQGGEATSERRRRDGVYQKSYKRAFLPLIYLLPRARVSRTSHAWRVHAARDKSKVSGFALPTISAIPRVRTYHTKEPSRFVHALSARPLKNVWRAWAEPVRQRKQGFSPAFSSGELTDLRSKRGRRRRDWGRRWRGLPRRMRCYYSILPKQTLSRYVRTHTFAKSSTARFAIA